MNGVQKTLYFSKRHDADLISLYHQIGRKAFVKVMKESLRVLVRAGYEPTFIKNLEIAPILLQDSGNEDEAFYIVVSFSSEKDTDIADLISNVKPKKLGAFIKNAMRLLIGPYYVLGCLLDGDVPMNNAFKDRKLFFVNGVVHSYAPVSKEKKAKKSSVKKATTNPKVVEVKEAKTTEYQTVQESTYEEPEIPVYQPSQTGGNEVFSDDDILALLDNM